MTALRSMLAWDARLQARYGFYAVYAVLTVAFVVGLRVMGPALRTDATVLLVVTDPTVLGFYFVAAMVLFEKDAGVLDALVTSPLGDDGYLLSKAITLSLLAVLASTAVAVLGHGDVPGLPALVAGVALGAPLFVFVGFVAVARYDSVNEYFISAVGWGSVLFVPLFGYVGLVQTPLFYLLPAQPVLVLVEAGFRPQPAWRLAYAVGYLAVADALAFAAARRAFRRYVVRGRHPASEFGSPAVQASAERRWPVRWGSRSPWLGLVTADLRNWVRDPLLAVAATGPLALALVVRVGAPAVSDLATPTVDLPAYYPEIAGSLVLFGPAIYGFVVGMFVLEDREQGVLTAYRVSPLSDRGYLLYRGASAYVLGAAATLPALAVVGLVDLPLAVLLGTVGVGALAAPAIALLFGTLAANTIDGLALSKLVNLVVLGPAVVVAVVPEPFQFLAGVLPAFWVLKAVVTGGAGDPRWPAFLLAGVLTHTVALVVLASLFSRRVQR